MKTKYAKPLSAHQLSIKNICSQVNLVWFSGLKNQSF